MVEVFPVVGFAPFLMIVGIVWIKSRARLEEKRIAARAQTAPRPDPQHEARVAELEDRVRVLERIVTDGGYDLASKIEALRDTRPVERALEARKPEEPVR
jgi:hypothetical protein